MAGEAVLTATTPGALAKDLYISGGCSKLCEALEIADVSSTSILDRSRERKEKEQGVS